jgi:hypothetical protein
MPRFASSSSSNWAPLIPGCSGLSLPGSLSTVKQILCE